jgi:2-polyprenyl-3-methyl-5-hydroxy-6-metoxy-1,4-benzoquinol methylase
MELEYVKCNICAGDNTTLVLTAETRGLASLSFQAYLNLVMCKRCNLIYVNPRPKLKFISQELYSNGYFATQFKDVKCLTGLDAYLHPEDIKERFNWISQFKDGGRLLDVGCATGVFLDYARSRNWQVFGVDVSEYAIKSIQEKFGFENLFNGELKDVDFPEDYFDVITVADVLEHTQDPFAFLLKIKQLLKNEGIVYIAVPNIRGLFFKIAILMAKFNLKNYFDLPYHLYYFSLQALELLLEKAGLKIVKLKLSEWKVVETGFRGFQKKAIALAANILGQQDRIISIAKKT